MTILEFFAPCRYGRDSNALPENCSEVQLIAERTEEFLQANHTWEDVLQLLNLHDAVWFSRYLFMSLELAHSRSLLLPRSFPSASNIGRYSVAIDSENQQASKEIYFNTLAQNQPTRFYEKIVRLMAQERPIAMTFSFRRFGPGIPEIPLSARSLAYVLDVNASTLKRLKFCHISLSQEHCRALSTFRGSLFLQLCFLSDKGRSILCEIEKNRGPTELAVEYVELDVPARDSALASTTTLKKFSINGWAEGRSGLKLSQLLQAVERNASLAQFHLHVPECEETLTKEWDDAVRSLVQHPTLEEVTLNCYYFEVEYTEDDDVAYQYGVRRANMIAEALKRNEVLRRLEIESVVMVDPDDPEYEPPMIQVLDDTIFEEQIKPLLKANDYRARLKALAKTETDCSLRLAVFGRALIRPVINPNASLVWTLLSGFQTELVAMLKTCPESGETAGEGSETQKRENKKQRTGDHG